MQYNYYRDTYTCHVKTQLSRNEVRKKVEEQGYNFIRNQTQAIGPF